MKKMTYARLPGLGCWLVLLTSAPSWGDEPATTDAGPPVKAGQLLVQLSSDGSVNHTDLNAGRLTFVDVASSLVAANGLGIDVSPSEPALRAQLGLEENSGLVVTAAPDDGRGAKAGLKIHDVIIQINEKKVADVDRFHELLDASDGRPVKLRLLRQGKLVDLEVIPKNPLTARLAAGRLWSAVLGAPSDQEHYRIGVTLSGTDQALRSQLRLAEGEGLVVTEVVDGGPAAAAGVQKHDVLILLDGKRLTAVEAINSQIQEIKDKEVELRLLRGGKELTLQIAPRKTQEAAVDDHVFTIWDTHNCQSCHQRGVDAAHHLMGTRLRAAHSAWTDGYRLSLFNVAPQKTEFAATAGGSPAPQQQIEALKTQLAEMQKALSALEAALRREEAKEK